MFKLNGIKEGKYGVLDTSDNITEYYSYSELESIIFNTGLVIEGFDSVVKNRNTVITDLKNKICKEIQEAKEWGNGNYRFAHLEDGETKYGNTIKAYFGDKDIYDELKKFFKSQGYAFETVPRHYEYPHGYLLACEYIVWEKDENVIRFNQERIRIEKYIAEAKEKGKISVFFTYIEGNGRCFCNISVYEKLREYFIEQGYKIIATPRCKTDGAMEYSYESIYWDSDDFTALFVAEKNKIMDRIKEAKRRGEHSIFFAYTEVTLTYRNMYLYNELKSYFSRYGFSIVKVPTSFGLITGGLNEYAKEEIHWT